MSKIWHKLRPMMPDNAAAGSVFIDSNALVAFNDFSGSVVCTRFFLDIGETATPFRTTREAVETDYVLGNYDCFVGSYERMLNDDPAEALVIVDGPVSSLIGLDMLQLGKLAKDRLGLPVLTVDSDGCSTYDSGISKALEALYYHLRGDVKGPDSETRKGVGIVGLNRVDFFCEEYREGIRRLVSENFGQVISSWGCEGDWSKLAEGLTAKVNVVASTSGLKLAKRMRDELSIPYTTLDACSEREALLSLPKDARVLIAGDQVVANCVRKLISSDEQEMSGVVVASFGHMYRELAHRQDKYVEDELAYIKLLEELKPQAVIGDSTLRAATPDGVAFYDFDNFSFFRRVPVRYAYDYSCLPFSEEWLEGLKAFCAQVH